jgi:predicted permease
VRQLLAKLRQRIAHFRTDTDIDDELRNHLDTQIEDWMAAGVPAEEARRRARLQLGSLPAIREKTRDQEWITMVEGFYRDFMLGLRALRKRPVFCLTAILTIAMGIGANTAIFSLLYGLLLRPLPVEDPSRLARIAWIAPGTGSRPAVSGIPWLMLQQFRKDQRSFSDISAWAFSNVTMQDGGGAPVRYSASLVSGNALQLLGIRPHSGRLLMPSDDIGGGPAGGWPVVLSYGLWNDRFHADAEIVGKQVKLAETVAIVIGVLPSDFDGVRVGTRSDMYLPLNFLTALNSRLQLESASNPVFVRPLGRLKPGSTVEQAAAEAATQKDALFRQFLPVRYQQMPAFRDGRLEVEPARTGLPSTPHAESFGAPLVIMQCLVAAVLIVCCINVSGLMLSNIDGRRQEFAIRTAIGAARWRLVRQYLTESFVIAVGGAALGGAAAWYGTESLVALFGGDPMSQTGLLISVDKSMFFFSGAAAILTTLLFGGLPAWRAARADPAKLLGSRSSAGRRQTLAGKVLVPIQISFSLALVVVAALLSQSLVRLRSEDTGFNVNQVTIQNPPLYLLRQEPQARFDTYQRMADRLEQMPGIQAASFVWHTPMTNLIETSGFRAVTGGANPPEDPKMAWNQVGPGYFHTMEIKVLAGRVFERNERSRDLCILNQAAAEFLFPRQEAMNQYVESTDEKRFPQRVKCRVTGIVGNAKDRNAFEPPPRTIYFPAGPVTVATDDVVFLMRSPSLAQTVAAYRKVAAELVPTIPVSRFATLRQQMDDTMGPQRLITMLCNVFGGLALLLSGLGLYGLLATSVARRRGEFGVRVAMGADRGKLVRMIGGEALRLLAIGVLFGGLLLIGAVRFVQGMLYGVSAFDPVTLAAVAGVLGFVAVTAALLPAWRAASVDPVLALRAD